MNVSVSQAKSLSLEAIGRFVEASEGIQFEGKTREEIYAWVEGVLCQQEYARQGKKARGLLRRYVEKMTGLSRAQVTRLVGSFLKTGRVRVRDYRRHRFAARFTRGDIELLVAVDEAHETLSGPATRRILEREYELYKKPKYARLAGISVSHLYNLRRSRAYRERRLTYTKTKPTAVPIGERRRPDHQGRPGFLRVDTVHQGDQPDQKGVYHINAVDEVTQWQIVAAAPQISESFLLPVLEQLMRQFPFRILGFHSDNGSEYINHTVAKLLDKLSIEQTKSRPRRSNDNGLVETKNGAVIRKHMGYGFIDPKAAEKLIRFYHDHFNPYLNYHRPCAQPEVKIDAKGRKRIRYKKYQTPLETLLALPNPSQYLRPGLSIDALKRVAGAISDTEAAGRMQKAKSELMGSICPITIR